MKDVTGKKESVKAVDSERHIKRGKSRFEKSLKDVLDGGGDVRDVFDSFKVRYEVTTRGEIVVKTKSVGDVDVRDAVTDSGDDVLAQKIFFVDEAVVWGEEFFLSTCEDVDGAAYYFLNYGPLFQDAYVFDAENTEEVVGHLSKWIDGENVVSILSDVFEKLGGTVKLGGLTVDCSNVGLLSNGSIDFVVHEGKKPNDFEVHGVVVKGKKLPVDRLETDVYSRHEAYLIADRLEDVRHGTFLVDDFGSFFEEEEGYEPPATKVRLADGGELEVVSDREVTKKSEKKGKKKPFSPQEDREKNVLTLSIGGKVVAVHIIERNVPITGLGTTADKRYAVTFFGDRPVEAFDTFGNREPYSRSKHGLTVFEKVEKEDLPRIWWGDTGELGG